MATRHGPPSPIPHLLTVVELRELFAALRADYSATLALTSDLPNPDRREAVVARLDAYGEALGQALAGGVEDATVRVCGPRALGGAR